MQRISDAEKQIMELIWSAEKPVTTSDIIQQLPEGISWKQNTVATFLSRLIKKGVLKATRIGKANQYEPCVTEQEYRNFETKEFIKDIHKGTIFGFLSALCDNGDLTRADIESLIEHLKE
jgi:BlaI family penicillinase repressor